MAASEEEILRCLENKIAVKEKCISRLNLVFNYDTEAVYHSNQTEVKKRPCVSSDQHRSFTEVDAVLN